jgi:pyruvate/2-oxoglutarate dehydrogenase complex dihydrolipoamide dehydrogenase (E3) component
MRAAGGVQDENQHSWLMKLVFRWEDRQLLAVHIVGDIAGELTTWGSRSQMLATRSTGPSIRRSPSRLAADL